MKNKKMLYIANVRMPTEKAHGIQIVKTCEALAARGIEVELLVPKRRNYIEEDAFDFYGVSKNFSLKKLWCLDLIFLPGFKKLTFWLETFTFYLSVKKYITQDKFDAYYTRDLPIALWLSQKTDIFYEIHTLPARPSKKYFNVWQRTKGLFVISEALKKDLVKFGVEESKISIIRDAVDVEKFYLEENKADCRVKLNLPLDKKIVLYTGHLYHWKGADLLAQTAEKMPDVEVYLVGGTKEDVAEFRQKYNFSNLHIVGWQKHGDIPYWLKAADVLVLPNSAKEKISSHYTSPMKLFEYMASKKPIIASKLSSISEVLDEDSAILVEPDNPRALAEGIKKALNDWELSGAVAENSYNKAGRFSWKNRAEEIKNFMFKAG